MESVITLWAIKKIQIKNTTKFRVINSYFQLASEFTVTKIVYVFKGIEICIINGSQNTILLDPDVMNYRIFVLLLFAAFCLHFSNVIDYYYLYDEMFQLLLKSISPCIFLSSSLLLCFICFSNSTSLPLSTLHNIYFKCVIWQGMSLMVRNGMYC